jgi:hypothetical protein
MFHPTMPLQGQVNLWVKVLISLEQYEQLMSLLPSTNQNIANFVGKVTHSSDTID